MVSLESFITSNTILRNVRGIDRREIGKESS